MAFRPTHWHIFAIAWLIHALRYAVTYSAALPQTPNETFVNRLSSKSRLPASTPVFGSLHLGFRFPSNRSPYLFESAVGVLSHLHNTPCQTSPDPTRLLTFARLFLGQRRDRIALALGKCRAGRCRYFPAFAFACQARFGMPHLRLVFRTFAFAEINNFHA
jgi:hypothetical protein